MKPCHSCGLRIMFNFLVTASVVLVYCCHMNHLVSVSSAILCYRKCKLHQFHVFLPLLHNCIIQYTKLQYRQSFVFVCLFVLRFYGPVNPTGSCQAQSVYLTTCLLGRLSPLSG